VFRRSFLFLALSSAPAWAQTASDFVTPYAPDGGLTSPVRVEKEGSSWKVSAIAGGSMGVKLNVAPFDAEQKTRLSFDYLRSNDARVNLFLRVNGRYFAVLFCGPKEVRPGTPVIYDARATSTKGHVEIPLRAALRSQLPDADKLQVDEILVGNWNNSGYLLAGIGGNGPGATWTLSNFQLSRPDAKPTFGAAHFEGQELVIPAKDLDALSWKNLRLGGDLGTVPLGTHFDARRGFVFNVSDLLADTSSSAPLPSVLPLRDEQEVSYRVSDGNDAVLTQGRATFHTSALPMPSPPRLRLSAPSAVQPRADFESAASLGSPLVPGASTVMERDDQNPYNGGWSARITNTRLASPFDVRLSSADVDVARTPVFSFAYRCDNRLRVDLNFGWSGQPYSVRFTDSDDPNPRLGDLNAVRDGQWHLATFNLLDALKKAKPDAKDFTIQNLQFSDTGWPGNVKGLKWWLDDFQWAPAASGKIEGQAVLLDASGTRSISYVLDQSPATNADIRPLSGDKVSVDLAGKTGLWWLHLRGQNGAGRWSETAHYPFWCG